jgi:excisionase family DNA binding protein
MRDEFQKVLKAARELPVNALPRLLGDLEEIRATAMARLTAPAPAAPQLDELLDVDEAARRLGTSKDYLYRHHARLPFTRRIGRNLRFSALGIERYIRQQYPIDSKTAECYIPPVVERRSTV